MTRGGVKEYFEAVQGRYLNRHSASLQPGDYDRVVIAFLGSSDGLHAELQQRGVAEEKLVTFFTADKGTE